MCFRRFNETWLHRLNHLHHQLASAPKPSSKEDQLHLRQLVERVMNHYEDYYRVKAHAATLDAFSMFSAPWVTSLEHSLQWIAGWRPTVVFHLIYTESSSRFQAELIDILRGHRTGDLGDLSPGQLGGVSNLQCETVNEENEITRELSDWQDGVCDIMSSSMGSDVDGKMPRLVKVLEKADNLRLKTMRRVVDLLTPQQAVEFLTVTAEMEFGIRRWGLEKDRMRVGVQCRLYVCVDHGIIIRSSSLVSVSLVFAFILPPGVRRRW
ncbi:protein DOG1-like 4 [Telopea speciosissima]|uniref:protein DOG1-like 4 n=1 Tax=Telopea speciosissima TaxID=54955 RepID=UPI001CC65C2C|nr:protein DOG1-like 4 [Telopea speciosissima]